MTAAEVVARRRPLAASLSGHGRAALIYAAAGWPIFPLQPGTKRPMPGTAGFHDATTNLDRITAWWTATPEANIGLPTGLVADVLDIDRKASGDGYPQRNMLHTRGLLDAAFATQTTRNGGQQLFFAGRNVPSRTHIGGHLVDIKGAGGYVVIPPGRVPPDPGVDGPGRYRWTGFHTAAEHGPGMNYQAIVALLDPPKPARQQPAGYTPGGDLDGLTRWVAGLAEGNRNHGLYWAACTALDGGHTNLDPLAEAARQTGLAEFEIGATLASARRRKATP